MTGNRISKEKATRVQRGSAPFSVMARVAMQLGRESISNSITAIIELVKNAYDADAEIVRIWFSGLKVGTPTLFIEDDGSGMNEDQLLAQWMVIGTPNKLLASRSTRKKRVLTGEKGLGRLGLDRLCHQTVLQTFHELEDSGTELVIDWGKYEDEGLRLEQIEHNYFKIPKVIEDPLTDAVREIKKGTRLILRDLKDQWSESSLKTLRNELDLLVSPFSDIRDFQILLDSGLNLEGVDGTVGSEYMLDAAEWLLEAEINEVGEITYQMSSPRYSEMYMLQATPWHERFQLATDHFPQCGPLKFVIYFFLRKNVELEDLSYTRKQIENFLDTNQGIRIYRDGFRVKPYGEPGGKGDWLNLSYRRVQHPQGVVQEPLGGWKVGYNQVIGAVFIGRENNSALIDQTNRESIVEEEAFFDLVRFTTDAIEFFEWHRQEFEMDRKKADDYEKAKERVTQKSQASTQAVQDLRTTTEQIIAGIQGMQQEGRVVDVEDLKSAFDKVIQSVDESVTEAQKAQIELEKATEQRQEELQRQKDTLGNLASLGILTASFGHEIIGATNVVASNAKQLNTGLERGLFMVTPDVRQVVEDNLYFIVSESEKIETFAKFTLRNLSRDKRNRRKVSLNKIAEQVFSFFDKALKEKNISVELNLAEVPPILAFQIDWESIFVNLITNAVWALQDTRDSERKIRIIMNEDDSHISIKFADSGSGLAASTEDRIFSPTFSTKRNERGEVIGTGMGLAIVKDFVESHKDGTIEVESPCDLGGAQFHILIKIPDLENRGKTEAK